MPPESVLVAGAALFLLLGRGRWVNLEEDHGFWFSAVQGLLRGGRALHEVRLQYGPVSLWVLESACRVFGASVRTIVAMQFSVGLAAVLAIQIFSRKFLSRSEQWLCAVFLTVLILWMAGPGNLLYPCAFAISQALLLSVAVMRLSCTRLGRDSTIAALLLGALAGTTFLTKQEFGLAAAWGIAALTLLDPALRMSRKVLRLGACAAGFIGSYAGILRCASAGDSLRQTAEANLLWPWVAVPAPWRALYARLLGLDRPLAHLVEAGDALLAIGVVGGSIWLILHGRDVAKKSTALWIGVAAAAGVWLWRWSEGSHFLPMTLCLPAMLLAGVWNATRERRFELERVSVQARGAFFAFWGAAILLLQREGYRGEIEGYYSGMGYVLAIPVVAALLARLAAGPCREGARAAAGVAALGAFAAIFGFGRLAALERRWQDTVAFPAPRGTVYLSRGHAPAFQATARFISESTRPGDSILILPSALGLDFLLDRLNLSFFPYVSPGFLTESGERELIERCRRQPPAAAVVFERSLGVLRSGDFGAGFATALTGWLDANLERQGSFSFPDGTTARWLLPGPAQSGEPLSPTSLRSSPSSGRSSRSSSSRPSS